jgi:hypothetical protein
MTTHRDAVLQALDRAEAPVDFFIRDDDAGWDDARLFKLLDTVAAVHVPIDLAVIPAACGDALASRLVGRMRNQPLGVHVHGWAHTNHETEGRKCEFGPARALPLQQADIAQGLSRLHGVFGPALDPIFTPPWNRCTPQTPALLVKLGFVALSRDRTAAAQAALPEIPVHGDWSKQWRAAAEDGRDAGAAIAADLATHVHSGASVGLMLHHAVMTDDELTLLRSLLQGWAAHPKARWLPMRALIQKTPS